MEKYNNKNTELLIEDEIKDNQKEVKSETIENIDMDLTEPRIQERLENLRKNIDNIYNEGKKSNLDSDVVELEANQIHISEVSIEEKINQIFQKDINNEENLFKRYLQNNLLDNIFSSFNQKINKDSNIIKILIRSILNPKVSKDVFINIFRKQEETIRSRSIESLPKQISNDELSNVYESAHTFLDSAQIDKEKIIIEQREIEKQALESQLDENKSRTYEKLKQGLNISIGEANFDEFKEKVNQAMLENPQIPLLEYLKNDKILDLSGYSESKVSLAIHDFYDHVLFTDILLEHGVIDSYTDLFQDIGDPLNTDMLSRIGERIASMAYQARKLLLIDLETYKPNIPANSKTIERLKRTLREGQIEFPDNSIRFLKSEELLDNLEFDFKILEFLLNEVLAEFMRENRARGPLKYVRGDKFGSDFLFFDKRYLSMLVEISQLLSTVEFQNEVKDWEYKLCGYVEKVLEINFQSDEPREFKISYDTVKNFDPSQELTQEKNDWIKKNLGFTTIKSHIY